MPITDTARLPSRLARWLGAARGETVTLLALLAVAAAVLVFVELAEEVMEGETAAFDRAVLLALRTAADATDPVGPPWFEQAVQEVTALGSIPVLGLMTLGVLGYLLILRKRATALLVLVSVGGGTALSSALKLLFARSRPDLVPHAVETATASFPSGHAMLSAVTYLTLGALLARVEEGRHARGYVLGVGIVLTLLVGFSRVYLGVHWPTDVLAGWSVGAAWAVLCTAVALRLQRRGAIERPGEPAEG
ncbi:MAG: phosphatase PAP2 family protein [Alphaproteobacteria bacterium]|nr:phosphatase PAP2 family protein [Alphaproteobacteria bacterium]